MDFFKWIIEGVTWTLNKSSLTRGDIKMIYKYYWIEGIELMILTLISIVRIKHLPLDQKL